MSTPLELKLVHLAYRQAGLDEEQYRMVLRNVAGTESAKSLSQVDLENVMAVLEDSGFRHAGKSPDYWRSKVALRGSFCGERMVRKIEGLAAQQKYDLAGLCRRVSDDRVARVDKLMPREAHRLIEALKAICTGRRALRPDRGPGIKLRALPARSLTVQGRGRRKAPVPPHRRSRRTIYGRRRPLAAYLSRHRGHGCPRGHWRREPAYRLFLQGCAI